MHLSSETLLVLPSPHTWHVARWPGPQKQLRSQHAHEAHSTKHADVTPQGPDRTSAKERIHSTQQPGEKKSGIDACQGDMSSVDV